jgi:hypothetical protein
MEELKVTGREKIGQIEFTGIEGGFGEDKKAMIVKDIAKIHGTTIKRINELINRNRKRFKDGIDVIDLLANENFKVVLNDLNFGSKEISNANNIYLLSERGYSKLLKILEDDKAWEIYDQLVDNYFNMRQAINENQPALLEGKHLELMQQRANTAQANVLLKIAKATKSDSAREHLYAKAAESVTGEMTIPIMKQKEYTATDIGGKLGITANKVGRIANALGLKAEQPGQNEFGRWSNSKSQHSDKEVPQWLYFEKGYQAIRKEVA